MGSLLPADVAEQQGLQRRPKQRRAIDLEAFEAGVEQNMLNRKGLFCLLILFREGGLLGGGL